MEFLVFQFVAVSPACRGPLWIISMSQAPGVPTTPPNCVSSADLLRVSSVPSSRSLKKKLSSTGPSISLCGTGN